VDLFSPVPLYLQLADLLRAKINGGEYGPGERMPSEARLQQEYGLARDTVRAAYRVLEEEGLVIALAGRGRFVKPKE
jgi:GntR family transcriptional regulator